MLSIDLRSPCRCRNAAGLAFHPVTGDLYFQENGIFTVDQLRPVGHGHGAFAHPQRAARRVVGGDDEQLIVVAEQCRPALPPRGRLGDSLGPPGADVEDGPEALARR